MTQKSTTQFAGCKDDSHHEILKSFNYNYCSTVNLELLLLMTQTLNKIGKIIYMYLLSSRDTQFGEHWKSIKYKGAHAKLVFGHTHSYLKVFHFSTFHKNKARFLPKELSYLNK